VDFSRTPEQQAFYDATLALATDVVAPGAAERDRDGRFDRGVWDRLAAAGLVGLPIPAQYGGSGGSILDCLVANEALGRGGRDGGLTLSLGAHWVIGAVPIWLHGSEELKQRWLPGLCDGSFIASWASTEPDAGSDSASLRTTAVRDGEDWVINGTKMFITNGPIADVCTVLARTSDRGATAFVVDTTTPGFRVGRELDKMGCRSSPTAEIVLTDCRVPGRCVLGVENEALWRVAFECFDWERTVMLASSIGGMEATLADAIAYAKTREQFGRPIAHFQVIAHKLAEMKINLEVCRTALYRAAWLKEHDQPHQVEASIDFPAERALRDAKLASIGGGTTEIQKMIISRALLAD
jgi:alkylation response protein AidB-like acyl-CoA dehydrogenase